MNKTLFFIKHGPEIRFLDSIKKNEQYDDIVLVVSENIIDEVSKIVGNDYLIMTIPVITKHKKHKIGTYLCKFSDSLVQRLNRKKNIIPFSYARKNVRKNYNLFSIKTFLLDYFLPLLIKPLLCTIKSLCFYLFKNNEIIKFFNDLSFSTLLLFDHLGGTDDISYNAKLAGLRIEYYLNNHKDLTIRPYAPLCADTFHIWFSCQQKFLQDICNTYIKTKAIGFTRIEHILQETTTQKKKNKYITILHCCADPKRRPYEVHSLKIICAMIQEKGLCINMNLRINPMDKSGIFNLFKLYDFVTIYESGWKWSSKKFINIPTKEDEILYINQILSADIISSLPSTALVEGICFKKRVICYTDEESVDYNDEILEVNMIIPECIQENDHFVITKSSQEYIRKLKDFNKC